MQDFDLDELRSWAHEGGAIARRYFNHAVARRKADSSLVSAADEEIEQLLVSRISARYPQHGILGEEQGRQGGISEFLWALDPLDGTAAFLAGLPLWGVSIGLLRAGRPYLGVVYLPLLDDDYWAIEDGGAWLNGQPIHVRPPREWDSEDWLAAPSNLHRRYRIDFRGKVRSTGSTAASLLYVARGSALAALVSRAAIWDLAGALAILNAAGGAAAYLSGAPFEPGAFSDGRPIREPTIFAEPSQLPAIRAMIEVIS